jgi:hypothetical protein|tara:strand:+ start:4296 stop:4463 length:168 start_codon:yes stop_codon:yes gene_type:complete
MTEQVEHGFAQVAILLAAELAVETAFFLLLAGLAGVNYLAKEFPQRAIKKQAHKL